MSVVPCNKTAIAGRSHSPVQKEVVEQQKRRETERGREEPREEETRERERQTNTGIENKARQIESY